MGTQRALIASAGSTGTGWRTHLRPGWPVAAAGGSTRFVVRTLNSRFPSQIHDPSTFVVAAVHFDSFHSIHGLLPRVLSPSALPSLLNLTARSSAHMLLQRRAVPVHHVAKACSCTASSEMHPQTASTCCFHADCSLMQAEMPPPPLPSSPGTSQSRRGPHCRSISCKSAAGGEEDAQGTGDPMLLRGLAS